MMNVLRCMLAYIVLHVPVTCFRWCREPCILSKEARSQLWSARKHGLIACAVKCTEDGSCSSVVYDRIMCRGYAFGTAGEVSRRMLLTYSIAHFVRHGYNETKGRSFRGVKGYKPLGSSGMEIKIHSTKLNWTDALKTCQSEGGTLAVPYPKTMRHLVIAVIKQTVKRPEDHMWIGLYDKYKNNTWYWIDGTAVKGNDKFSMGEPDNMHAGLDEDCGMASSAMILGIKWYDGPCRNRHSFTCTRESND